jgi:hypothetical protein
VVDLVGLKAMTKTLGFQQLAQGFSMAISHPIIGQLSSLWSSSLSSSLS